MQEHNCKKKKKREKKTPKLNIVLHISPLYLIASQPLLPISPSTVGDTQLLHTHTHTRESEEGENAGEGDKHP